MHSLRSTILSVCLITLSAAAQNPAHLAFDLERLELDPSAVGSLLVETGRTLPEHEFRLGAGLQYERKPLVAAVDGQVVSAVVRDRLLTELFGAYALTSRFELGLQLPIISYQQGQDVSAYGLTRPREFGLGTPRVSGRVGLLSEAHQLIDLAAEVAVGVPLGTKNALGGDGQFSLLPRISAGRQLKEVRLSTQVGVLLRPYQSVGNDRLGSHFGWDTSVAYAASAFKPELIFRAAIPFRSLPSAFELLAALRLPLAAGMEAFVLGGPGFGRLIGTPIFRAVAGLAYAPPATSAVAAVPPPVDPCIAGQSHAPEQCPELDDDSDGIPNKDDRCPLEKGLAQYQGCPMPDRDHDGVPDDLDQCPDEPGPPENHGCPIKVAVAPPVSEKIAITGEKIVINEKIFFETGKTTIQSGSHPLLKQLAGVILGHPEISLIRVEGHTDDRGGPAFNQKLSQGRADAVRQFLIDNGVAVERLRATGFGLTRPLESNTTAAGRSKNRRVEFTILDSTSPGNSGAPGQEGKP